MTQPIITLTTDFGLTDHFVGAMKGVILSIAPKARIIDITHGVPAFEVREGAFVFDQAYRCFPKGAIHVVVVDPGVGSERRPILAVGGGYSFIAPDNGVLTTVLQREKCVVREITADRYFRKPVSQTFHGRDVFAPSAAHLAAGVAPAKFGKRIDNAFRLGMLEVVRTGKRAWSGSILRIDKFGNIITNFPCEEFAAIRERPFEMQVGFEPVSSLQTSYSGARFGEPFVIEGSAGFLEVALKQADAARALGVGVGAPLELKIY
ncbi:MAG: Adenosyl-chloride synthase [Bryobacteraceae bacterium]|nr:Adenosyl-chloride synthase [Bryobacteraceae bacterium]